MPDTVFRERPAVRDLQLKLVALMTAATTANMYVHPSTDAQRRELAKVAHWLQQEQ